MTPLNRDRTGSTGTEVDLKLDRVSKSYSSITAVREVSFEATSGEFISFLGPSGCGKTTTLSMIAGFQDVTSGAISIRGRRIDGLPPEKRNTGMVFQDYALFPHMSVAENVAFGLRMRYVPKAEIKTRVLTALSLVRMSQFADRRPSQLSGGQKQRVALARAFVIEPDILLLDEPFGALDRQLREQMQFELKALQQSIGITTVFVTHDQEEALLLSSRIAVMNQGEIQQFGSPTEIYEKPATTFVAQFIGKSNFLKGDVVSSTSAGVVINTPAGQIVATAAASVSSGQTIECMVRPEQIQLLKTDAPANGTGRLRATVRQVAYHGASSQVILTLPGDIEFVTIQSSQTAIAGIATVGQPVDLTWSAAATTLFVDGRRIH